MTRENWKTNNLCVGVQINVLLLMGTSLSPVRRVETVGPECEVKKKKRAILSGMSKGSCVLDDVIIPRRYRLIYRGILES